MVVTPNLFLKFFLVCRPVAIPIATVGEEDQWCNHVRRNKSFNQHVGVSMLGNVTPLRNINFKINIIK